MSNELTNEVKKNDELIERPDFLAPSTESASGEMTGMEQMSDHHQIAYFKIVQSQAKPELREMFGEGDCIITPQMMRIITREEVFHFVPFYAYTEYTLQNPIQAKGLQFIRERTFDRNSEIARKARSRNFEDREEPCPESPKNMMSHVEHLNYVILLLDHNDAIGASPIVVSFFKSEWKRGMSLNSLLRARKKHCDNICGCRLQAGVSLRRNDQGSWYGLDIVNPDDGQPWITQVEDFESYKALQKQISDSYSAAGLAVDYGDYDQTVNGEVVDSKY